MDHREALQLMAVERYLLDELSPAQKEEFEQHMSSCLECTLDLRVGQILAREIKEGFERPPTREELDQTVNIVLGIADASVDRSVAGSIERVKMAALRAYINHGAFDPSIHSVLRGALQHLDRTGELPK